MKCLPDGHPWTVSFAFQYWVASERRDTIGIVILFSSNIAATTSNTAEWVWNDFVFTFNPEIRWYHCGPLVYPISRPCFRVEKTESEKSFVACRTASTSLPTVVSISLSPRGHDARPFVQYQTKPVVLFIQVLDKLSSLKCHGCVRRHTAIRRRDSLHVHGRGIPNARSRSNTHPGHRESHCVSNVTFYTWGFMAIVHFHIHFNAYCVIL